MELELERILGLPAHPLLAHAPVVLVPLATLGGLACAVSRRARRRIGWVVVALAAVAVVSVQLAIGSGEELEESVRRSALVDDHAGVADTLLPVAAAFLAAVTGLVGLDHRRRRRDTPAGGADTGEHLRRAVAVLAVATVVSAAASDVWVFRAGHSGARAVWDDPARPMLTR